MRRPDAGVARGRRAHRPRRRRRRGDARRARARRPARRADARRGAALRRARRAAARRPAAGGHVGGARRPGERRGGGATHRRRRRPRRRRRTRPRPGGAGAGAGARAARARAEHLLSGERGRFLAGISPVVAIFLVAAWQATTGAVSLADVLSFLGVIIVALLAGVFPVLLLVAARRRGELIGVGLPRPGAALGARRGLRDRARRRARARALHLGRPAPARRRPSPSRRSRCVMTAGMTRNGTFAPRATAQLRHDLAADTAQFSVVVAGRPARAEAVAEYDDGRRIALADGAPIDRFSALRSVTFTTRLGAAGGPPPAQLKVWAHRITAEQESEPLAVSLELDAAGARTPLVLDAGGGATLPAADAASRSSCCSSASPTRARSASDRRADLVERRRRARRAGSRSAPSRPSRARRGSPRGARPRRAAARRRRGRRRGCGARAGGRRRARAPRRRRRARRCRRASS